MIELVCKCGKCVQELKYEKHGDEISFSWEALVEWLSGICPAV